MVTSKSADGWSEPQVLSFSGKYHDIEPFFSNNDQRLYFASNRPLHDSLPGTDYNIWYVQKEPKGWNEPIALPKIINTSGDEFFPSISDNGNWSTAENMGRPINTQWLDYCPFIDLSRENFYFTSERRDTTGMQFKSRQELIDYARQPLNGLGNIFKIALRETPISLN